MNNLMCTLFRHKFVYNFPTLPSKGICCRCGQKIKLNSYTLLWEKVTFFDNEKRSDEELCNNWF